MLAQTMVIGPQTNIVDGEGGKLGIFWKVYELISMIVGAFYVVLNDVLVHFFNPVLKIKKTRVFPLRERLGMTTVGMPGHGFTFPVGGIYRSSYF